MNVATRVEECTYTVLEAYVLKKRVFSDAQRARLYDWQVCNEAYTQLCHAALNHYFKRIEDTGRG